MQKDSGKNLQKKSGRTSENGENMGRAVVLDMDEPDDREF
jgi:hypothetical protein